ncbi:MAG: hypothetical protein IJW86_09010 [Clostridia bacterium]|nr:hypothetical protein [Clostridia bacterium]
MKHKIVVSVLIVFILGFAVSSLFSQHSDYYTKYEDMKYGFIPYYSTIDKKCSDKDRQTAQSFVDLAGEIMTDVSGNELKNAGELSLYSVKKAEVSRAEAKINLITADFTFSNGYMWVEYTKKDYDNSENLIEEKEALAYWKLKKQDGIWSVVKIKEVAC